MRLLNIRLMLAFSGKSLCGRLSFAFHALQGFDQNGIVPIAESHACRPVQQAHGRLGPFHLYAAVFGELEGVTQILLDVVYWKRLGRVRVRQHGFHPMIAQDKAVTGTFRNRLEENFPIDRATGLCDRQGLRDRMHRLHDDHIVHQFNRLARPNGAAMGDRVTHAIEHRLNPAENVAASAHHDAAVSYTHLTLPTTEAV